MHKSFDIWTLMVEHFNDKFQVQRKSLIKTLQKKQEGQLIFYKTFFSL